MLKKLTGLICVSLCLGLLFSLSVSAAPENGSAQTSVQGEGYETQEEAAIVYISGMINMDMQEMLSACAVEIWVDNYDAEKQIERTGALVSPLNSGYIPADNSYAYMLNLENRRNLLVQNMKYQYLVMTGSPIITEYMNIVPLSQFESPRDLIDSYFTSDSPEIEFTGIFIPPIMLDENYFTYMNQFNMARNAYAENAQQISSVAALIYVNDEPYLLTLGTERYNDRWYISTSNFLGMLLGLESTRGGMCSVTEMVDISRDQVEALYDMLLSDGEYLGITGRVSEIVGEIDLNKIFSLPEDERMDAYHEAYIDAIFTSLTEEERDYVENIPSILDAAYNLERAYDEPEVEIMGQEQTEDGPVAETEGQGQTEDIAAAETDGQEQPVEASAAESAEKVQAVVTPWAEIPSQILPYDITWGMNMDEVLEREEAPLSNENVDQDNVLTYQSNEDEEFDFTGIAYYFENNELSMYITMAMNGSDADESVFESFKDDLTAKYGISEQAEGDYVTRVMSKADDGYEPNLVFDSCLWNLPDGTQIVLTAEEVGHSSCFYTIYLSPAYVESIK